MEKKYIIKSYWFTYLRLNNYHSFKRTVGFINNYVYFKIRYPYANTFLITHFLVIFGNPEKKKTFTR